MTWTLLTGGDLADDIPRTLHSSDEFCETAGYRENKAVKAANPSFMPWECVSDEVVSHGASNTIVNYLAGLWDGAESVKESWDSNKEEEKRLCGDVPRFQKAMMCSCSSWGRERRD
jgi:hypothetical protein